MTLPPFSALLVVLLTSAEPATLRVRATLPVRPCVEAAIRSWTGGPVDVRGDGDGDADVLVAGSVEVTRAIEGGGAVEGTELDVAEIPWVLVGPHVAVTGLTELSVAVPAGDASYEAMRLLRQRGARPTELADPEALRRAPTALVPLSLAPPGQHTPADLPPIVAQAALLADSPREAPARRFVAWLGSDQGKTAFARCGR